MQSPEIQLPVLYEYVLRTVGIVLQLRIAPAPCTRIIIKIIALFVVPFAHIQTGAIKFILPNEIHARDHWVVWRSNSNILMIAYIRSRGIRIADQCVVNIIVSDAAALLPV
ncbi:hypothetical protein D3C77_434360 [compost metagenome]